MSAEECVDLSENFRTCTRFSSREELINWVRGVGKEHNVVVAIRSSSKSGTTRASGRVDLGCKKSGKPRKRGGTDESKKRRQSRSNKLECPFHLRGCEQLSGGWLLHVLDGKHNHDVGKHVKSPSVRLRKDDIMIVERLSKSLPPKQILNCLQSLKGCDSITIKQIYNAKNKMKYTEEHDEIQVDEENLQEQMIKVQEKLFQEAIDNIKNRPEKERVELYARVIEVAFSDRSISREPIAKSESYVNSSVCEGERCTSATMPSESSPLFLPPIVVEDGLGDNDLRGSGNERGQDCGLVQPNTFTLFSSGQFISYIAYIPSFMAPYVHGWLDVKHDGNCGFRAIARNFYEDQERWMQVRKDLYLDVDSRPGLYEKALIGFKSTRELCNSLSHWSADHAPVDKWMSPDMGFVIATRYNKVLVILSSQESHTFFPLTTTDSKYPDGEIVISYLHNKGHFIAVDMLQNFPLPPISVTWRNAHDSSVANLPLRYTARLQKYAYLQGAVQPSFLQNIDWN
ncbi:hypothetical protein LIER_29293 [Lithospermum erythrorhizon]|uniref:OTU domain-containing protein n=1 Tax=Lithospermum erythrorhizon TaxID=34254 RepID=A0AAV3RJP1_LITER